MRSNSIPGTITAEALGKWITDNSKDSIIHKEEIPLDDDVIKELEHKSSMASRRIDELKALKKNFDNYLNKGTDVDHDAEVEIDQDPPRLPMTIIIPPTKGLKELTKNREFADKQLRDGFKTEEVKLYMIPVPEEDRMVAVDIEGVEYEQYNREMNEVEKGRQQYAFKNNSEETVTHFPDRAEASPKKKKKKKIENAEVEPEPGDQEGSVNETSDEAFI